MEPYCDLPFSFHDHGSQVVAEMLRDMIYLPGLGLGRWQQGIAKFIKVVN